MFPVRLKGAVGGKPVLKGPESSQRLRISIMSDVRYVEIHRAANEIEAHLIQGDLQAAGISAQITNDAVLGVYPGLWWASPRILVAEADAEKAAAIIRDIEDRHKTRSDSEKSNERSHLP